MLRTRIIPCLLLKDESLVKTVKFKQYNYIGDPINTVRIFNELEVDELMFLDIFASKENRPINFSILQDIANECFMPLSYGGNIRSIDDTKRIFEIGFEKIVINSNAYSNINIISEIAAHFGKQSVVGSIDVKTSFLTKKKQLFSHHGTHRQSMNPLEWAKTLENAGAGELLITSIDREGTWNGYDLDLVQEIADQVTIPVIANGGAGSIQDISDVVKKGHASAAGISSMILYQKKEMGVLVNFPHKLLHEMLS